MGVVTVFEIYEVTPKSKINLLIKCELRRIVS